MQTGSDNALQRRVLAPASRVARGTAAFATCFGRDRRGIAAVEFAFLMPVLLCIYFGSIEVMQAIDTNRKLSRAAAQIADLVSQDINLNKTDIDAIMNIGAATLRPYNRSGLQPDIRITAVKMSNNANPTATVLWKRNRIGGSFSGSKATSETVDVPATFKVKDQVIVKVEMSMKYNLMLSWNGTNASNYGVAGFFNGIPMKETYYFRPRIGDTVNCSDCG